MARGPNSNDTPRRVGARQRESLTLETREEDHQSQAVHQPRFPDGCECASGGVEPDQSYVWVTRVRASSGLGQLKVRRMPSVGEIADDLEIAGVVGEEGDTVDVCGGSDREVDRAPARLAAPVAYGG